MTYRNPIGRYRPQSLKQRVKRHIRDIDMMDRDAKCSQRAEGDEFVCHCGLRWSIDEERPECIKKGLSA